MKMNEKFELSRQLSEVKGFLEIKTIELLHRTGTPLKDCLKLYFLTKCNSSSTIPCYVSNNFLAEFFGVSEQRVKMVVGDLVAIGYIHRAGKHGERQRPWHLGCVEVCSHCRTPAQIAKAERSTMPVIDIE
jgi:hypothetical protein